MKGGVIIAQERNEALATGDLVRLWCGAKRIVAIHPYSGPLADVIFAIAEYAPGADGRLTGGFSLELGGHTEVIREVRS